MEIREELRYINQFAKTELAEDQVYAFAVRLCDNEVDRDFERFDTKALEELGRMFLGKSGIFDHQWSAKGQTARIYRTEVVREPSMVTAAGDAYCWLKGWAYLMRTEKHADLIAEIEGGIKKEVSVGCSVAKRVCSVCGAESGACHHVPGQMYGEQLCFTELKEPLDAYEWSFVAVPAQKNAGVIKSFNPVHETEKLAEMAREYKNEMQSEILRCAASVLPEMKSASLDEICGSLSLGMLREMRDAFRKNAQKNLPVVRQLDCGGADEESENSEYKI